MHVSRAPRIWRPVNPESSDFHDLDVVFWTLGFALGTDMRTSYHSPHNFCCDSEIFEQVQIGKV
jgi:hypothetical protein